MMTTEKHTDSCNKAKDIYDRAKATYARAWADFEEAWADYKEVRETCHGCQQATQKAKCPFCAAWQQVAETEEFECKYSFVSHNDGDGLLCQGSLSLIQATVYPGVREGGR